MQTCWFLGRICSKFGSAIDVQLVKRLTSSLISSPHQGPLFGPRTRSFSGAALLMHTREMVKLEKRFFESGEQWREPFKMPFVFWRWVKFLSLFFFSTRYNLIYFSPSLSLSPPLPNCISSIQSPAADWSDVFQNFFSFFLRGEKTWIWLPKFMSLWIGWEEGGGEERRPLKEEGGRGGGGEGGGRWDSRLI